MKGLKLKSTGQNVYQVPHQFPAGRPQNGYTRVFIPYSKTELRNARNNRLGHVQVVRSSNLTTEK